MSQPPPATDQDRFQTVTLSLPIQRGDLSIPAINLRKPKAGELRGLTLQDILTTDVTALLTLIPRVSDPPLTRDEADALEPEDLAEIGGAIRGFFLTAGERTAIAAMVAEHQPKS